MSRRERKAGHGDADAYLLGAMDEDEIEEVVEEDYIDDLKEERKEDDSYGI